jgi:hypothetical protein
VCKKTKTNVQLYTCEVSDRPSSPGRRVVLAINQQKIVVNSAHTKHQEGKKRVEISPPPYCWLDYLMQPLGRVII